MLEIGSLVDGKYKILSEIGRGGMSVVYMAINEKANKTWAVKEIRKDGIKDFEVVKQGLIVETDLLKKLNHPNLPSIIDVIEDDETFLIVMDYIEGNPLSKTLEEYGAQPQDFVIDCAIQLCDVLGYLHTREIPIVYRDMKPANVMLNPDGLVTLIDFGIAREYKEKNMKDTTCLGTVGYAAPEQFGGQGQTDARTDIYCLGATLYHLVTGRSPCDPPYEIKPIREINPSLSGGLERIITKCTQRDPNDRYQSCAELMYALEHFEDIDEIHRKKQKIKLRWFIACTFLSLILAFTSGWGYFSAEAKKGENYQVIITEASDLGLTQEQRVVKYLEAIKTDPTQTAAYLQMIDLIVSGSENTGLSKSEVSVITQLQAGLDRGTGGFSSTIYPLEQLKSSNPAGYAEVCYEIGMAFWYEYEVESDRYSAAADWFSEAAAQYPIAQVYCEIGECQQQIKKYAGQNRTEKMYETYAEMWSKLEELKEAADTLDESDMKLLVWPELVRTISSKAQYFLVSNQKTQLLTLLDAIDMDATDLLAKTEIQEVKDTLQALREDIRIAKQRISTLEDEQNEQGEMS